MPRDDLDDDERPASKKRSGGDNTLKIILIVFGSLIGLTLLSCCGVGGYFYFQFQKAVREADMKEPADVRRITADLTEITIPPEFIPKHASIVPILNIKQADYQWCPSGSCPDFIDNYGKLSLSSFDVEGQPTDSYSDPMFDDEFLKSTWKDHTRTEHEFDIRGKKCKFYIVRGEYLTYGGEEMEDLFDDVDGEMPVNADDPAPQDSPAATTPPVKVERTGRPAVQVHGEFPGKKGTVTLELWLNPDDYQEQKILDMLRSIR